jgi:heme a synthase
MIIIGGITRLTGSGLSITEWNLISGVIPPLSDDDWIIMFDKYQQFPQYQKLNYGMTLEAFKSIFFWEYLHRLLGRLIGFVFFIPFLIFYFKKQLNSFLLKRMLLILMLGALQGFLGWFMVKSGLVSNPHVNHIRLASHLMLALLLLSLIFLTALRLLDSPGIKVQKSSLVLSAIIIILICIQIIYGAFTAGLKAGYAYNTFPSMNGEWVPSGLLKMMPVCSNFTDNGITVQWMHRCIAGLLLSTGVFAIIYSMYKKDKAATRYFGFLSVLIFLQITLGIVTLLFKVPVFAGVLHQCMAVFLLMSAIGIHYRFRT